MTQRNILLGYCSGKRPILAIDFETSDLPQNGGHPIQFAACLVDPETLEPVQYSPGVMANYHDDWHSFKVNIKMPEGAIMSPSAFAKHRITWEHLEATGKSPEEAKDSFFRWLASHGFATPIMGGSLDHPKNWWGDSAGASPLQVLGQNVNFDLHFLWKWLGPGYTNLLHYKYLDTMVIGEFMNTVMDRQFGPHRIPFKNNYGTWSTALEWLCAGFDISYDGAHDSQEDVYKTVKVYKCMVEELQDDLDRSQHSLGPGGLSRLSSATGLNAGKL